MKKLSSDQRLYNNRNRQLICRYGITLAQKEQMFKDQNGLCKICKEPKQLVVEHNHEDGVVRGLTCNKCNTLLGQLETITEETYYRALEYLYSNGDIK